MPKLSIITVNYNNRDGLIDTAESVVTQTWTDYEWIIIDGGSTDGSAEVIKEYAAKTDKLVYWCSESDGGIYQGMNKGIDRASGEYCYFLNSGDYIYNDTTLENIFKIGFEADIVYGNLASKYDKNIYRHEILIWCPQKVNVKSPFYWVKCHNSLPHSGGTLFSQRILEKTNGYDTKYKIAADKFLYMVSIFKFEASAQYIPIVMAFFDRNGITNSDRKDVANATKRENNEMAKRLFPRSYKILHMIAFMKYQFLFIIPIMFIRTYNLLNKVICLILGKKYLFNNKTIGSNVL